MLTTLAYGAEGLHFSAFILIVFLKVTCCVLKLCINIVVILIAVHLLTTDCIVTTNWYYIAI